VFLLAACPAFPGEPAAGGGENYCPIGLNLSWTYSFFSKKENRQKDDIPAVMQKTEKINGIECYVYNVPSKKMAYFITRDAAGVYIRSARVSLPVFSFINMDIDLDPPMCAGRFPLKDGDSWKYDGTAKVRMLVFINIEKKLSVKFIVSGREKVTANGVAFNAYHIHAVSSRRWQDDEPVTGDAWLAENTGVVRAETKNSLIELK